MVQSSFAFKMEDLASFIKSLSEKYGLLDIKNEKIESAATSHLQQRRAPTLHRKQEDYGQENGGDLGADTSWESLTSFLRKRDLQYNDMHNFRTKKPSTKKRRELNGQLKHHDHGGDNVEEAPTLSRPESGSSDRASSLANTIQTSDLIQKASFLDELQNPSLSEDLQSTGMTKGRDSLDDNDLGQSSLLQEFLVGDGEKDVGFAKDMGLPSFNECSQKGDAQWHSNSDAWFREFQSTRHNFTSSLQRSRRMDTKVAEELCWDRAHDTLASSDILSSSRSSSSATNTEPDGQAEDCHSASASQCGASDAVAARSRCASPEGFAEALESVERGRERAAIVNARVEKMLEESDSHNRPVRCGAEAADKKSIDRLPEDTHAVQDVGKVSELRFGIAENGSVGSLKKRIADMDEGNRRLLTQLDKSRSLLSPSKQPTMFRSRSSASERSEASRQSRRFNEEVGDRSEQGVDVSFRHLGEGGSVMLSHQSQEKVSSPHEEDPHSRASSRNERYYKPGSRVLSIHEGDSAHKPSPHCPGQRSASSRHQEIDHQPSVALPADQLHTRLNVKKDSSRDGVLGPNLKIRIPNFEQPADQYGSGNADGQNLPENQKGLYNSRDKLTPHHHNQYNGSLAVSPMDTQRDDYKKIREGKEKFESRQPSLVHSGRNNKIDEAFCARTKKCYNFRSSWGNEWTEVEEEGIETTDPIQMRTPVGQSKWDRVNNLLCQSGFPTIRCSNVQASDFEEDCHLVLSDVVSNYERREMFVQALLEEGDELRQVEERNHLHIQQLESECDETKQKLAASERRAEVAAKAAERNCTALRRDCQKLESAHANLMQRCSQLEHACRAKEHTLQKLQDKVRESMVKEDRHRNNDKEVYEKLKHKVASAQHTNGEVLEPNFLQRDLKPAQIVGIYERQKVILETEISNLREENAQLCREICEKENIISNKVLGTEETKNALDLLSRKQQLQIDEKMKEINRLENELKERPTKREVEETIRSASRQEEATVDEGVRDESNFEKILRQICQLLELEDPSFIVETLENLLVLVSAVPRMEQFVTDVCDVVFCDGHMWSPPSNDEENGANRTPEAVPGVLKSWLQKLETSSELLSFKETVEGMLWERAEKKSELEPEISCNVVIGCVKNLIDIEQDYLATKASYRTFDLYMHKPPFMSALHLIQGCGWRELTSDADAIVKAEPQKLLHRIVAHFQMLFEVPKLEGVMAVMNSVYIKCTEYHNFARALSSMLGLNKEEGPNTIIAAVNSIMSQGRA